MPPEPSYLHEPSPAAARAVPGPTDLEEPARRALGRGDRRAALAILMQLHGGVVHRYSAGLLRDRQQADDMLQTVFIVAFQSLDGHRAQSSFKAWLLGIARHRCLDELRRARRWSRLVTNVDGDLSSMPGAAGIEDADGAEEAAKRQVAPALEQCLSGLPAVDRDSVLLRFRQNLAYSEMAEISGQTTGALRVRVCRALRAMRRCLEKKGVRLP